MVDVSGADHGLFREEKGRWGSSSISGNGNRTNQREEGLGPEEGIMGICRFPLLFDEEAKQIESRIRGFLIFLTFIPSIFYLSIGEFI